MDSLSHLPVESCDCILLHEHYLDTFWKDVWPFFHLPPKLPILDLLKTDLVMGPIIGLTLFGSYEDALT